MTQKQQNIINAALELFSNKGFHTTSTSKIAKKARVSEGLIFRHFKNKEGLIESLRDLNENQIKLLFTSVLNEEDSKQVIKKTVEIPFSIDNNDIDHWRLHYKFKWEINSDHSNVMEQLKEKLVKAFTKLKYKKPQLESDLLLRIVDSYIISILYNKFEDKTKTKDFLIQKYYL